MPVTVTALSSVNYYSKRVVLAVIVLLTIGIYFWTQSRYPNLDEKALMGGELKLQDPLSFEAKHALDPTWPLWKSIYYTTLNWMWTNRRGMIFGVFFGATFLTLLRYLPWRSFKSGFANAFMGFAVGAPLGVCVNCASPVAAGLYTGGTRAESTLAAMMASPTFNAVVLTMIFALMPFYLAATKIVLTLAVILIAVPLICRLLPRAHLQIAPAQVNSCIVSPMRTGANRPEGALAAVIGFAGDFAHNLWFIIRTSVPLMVAAGFLGAVVATLVPFESMANLPVNIFTVTAAAIIGVFAPVPMAFDVVLAAVLLNAGVPVAIVMTLFFTLGIFSIYSFIVVTQTISLRAASLVTAAIVVLGVAGGLGADAYHRWQASWALKALQGFLDFDLIPAAHAQSAPSAVASTETATSRITVIATPLKARSPAADKLFTRMEARHIGIDRPNDFSMANMFTPFIYSSGSLSAADIDNDGDQDLAMALVDGGMRLFLNDGTGKFTETAVNLPTIAQKSVFNAIPTDLNNDGWLDLFVTTHHEGNFVFWSDEGTFSDANHAVVKSPENVILDLVAGFGDPDRDGDLDVALGTHMASRQGWTTDERDRDRVVFNDNGRITGEHFLSTTGTPGDTLSNLFSDFNQDGLLDLVEANDFNQPDVFYLGDGKGGFRQIKRADAVIPVTTHTTMSVKTADLDNDGDFEIYLSQIAGRADGVSERLVMRPWSEYCSQIEREDDRAACQANVDIKDWYRVGTFSLDLAKANRCLGFEEAVQAECKAMVLRDIAIQTGDKSLCESIPDDQLRVRVHCDIMFSITREPAGLTYPEDILQLRGGNVLLVRKDDGTFEDRAKQSKLEIGGWSWDVKIYDFDNDEDQDIYILNGFWAVQDVAPSKIYFTNNGELNFQEATEEAGLTDFLIMPSAAAADFDNDGDIDMVTSTLNGPIIAFRNNSQDGSTIAVELRDHIGNRYGIGSKIAVQYGDGGAKQQLRELQLSGGFTAFDAPVLHYGLGGHDSVARIKVEWSTGEKTEIEGPFPANARYTIERRPKQPTN